MAQRKPNPNELRDLLANERTLLAWIRTAITLMGLGFVVAKFGVGLKVVSGSRIHLYTVRTGTIVGVLLVLSGVLTAGVALLNFQRIHRGILEGEVRFSPRLVVLVSFAVLITSVLLTGYIVATE